MTDYSVNVGIIRNMARVEMADQTLNITVGADAKREHGCPVEMILGALGS